MIYSKRNVALERPRLAKSPQSDKKPKQAKVPNRKKATIVPDSSSSEEMGVPGCRWWLDDRTTGNAKHPAEIAREIKAEKANMEKNIFSEEEDEKERNSSSDNEQSRKAENRAEHAFRENPTTDEAVHEETKTAPVKANVELEISHENPRTRKSGRKTKKPDWLGHNGMVKTVNLGDDVAGEK